MEIEDANPGPLPSYRCITGSCRPENDESQRGFPSEMDDQALRVDAHSPGVADDSQRVTVDAQSVGDHAQRVEGDAPRVDGDSLSMGA